MADATASARTQIRNLLRAPEPAVLAPLLRDENITFIAAADLFGSAGLSGELDGQKPVLPSHSEGVFHIGDVVVHLDHGMANLEGLETVAAGTEQPVARCCCATPTVSG